jgi:GNAT superfamily N-acetyltransferase
MALCDYGVFVGVQTNAPIAQVPTSETADKMMKMQPASLPISLPISDVVVERRHGEFVVSTDRARLDLNVIHGFLTTSYWSKGIPREVVERAIEHSMCFGVYDRSGAQVGFARVISDFATFAYVADVFVLESHRGHGLGKGLMGAIVEHPRLQGLRRWSLSTLDAHGLYAQVGFAPLKFPDRYMEILRLNAYQKA